MLTNLVLGIIVTAGALFGLYLMKGMDHFMDEQKQYQEKAVNQGFAVIFGKHKEAEIIAGCFERAGIKPILMETLYIDREWKNVEYMAAVSNSDIDNLTACNLFHKMYPTAQIYGLCNDKSDLKLYRQSHINVFLEKEELLQRLELLIMEHEVGAA